MLRSGKPLSELAAQVPHFPQVRLDREVSSKPPQATLANANKAIAAAERTLGSDGRVLVRYSGTSDLIRVMLEGKDETLINELAEMIVEGVDKDGILRR